MAKKQKKPSFGLTAKERSDIVKKAKKGVRFGVTKAKSIIEKATKSYNDSGIGKNVFGSIFWKKQAKKKKTTKKRSKR